MITNYQIRKFHSRVEVEEKHKTQLNLVLIVRFKHLDYHRDTSNHIKSHQITLKQNKTNHIKSEQMKSNEVKSTFLHESHCIVLQ